jgi:hypothetical protein
MLSDVKSDEHILYAESLLASLVGFLITHIHSPVISKYFM